MSLRAQAQQLLFHWSASDADQDRLRRDYLDHLHAHPDATWRSCARGHLTASALVVDAAGGRVLLTLHRKLGRWLQLGGHCEPGDASLADAAAREAREESGLDGLSMLPGPVRLDRHPVQCRPDGPSLHLDVQYVALAAPGAVVRVSAESLDLQWFGYDALPAATDESVRRLVAAARAQLAAGVGGAALPQRSCSPPPPATTSSSPSDISRPAAADVPSR